MLINKVHFLHLRKNSIITKWGIKDKEEHKASDEDIKQITNCILISLYWFHGTYSLERIKKIEENTKEASKTYRSFFKEDTCGTKEAKLK